MSDQYILNEQILLDYGFKKTDEWSSGKSFEWKSNHSNLKDAWFVLEFYSTGSVRIEHHFTGKDGYDLVHLFKIKADEDFHLLFSRIPAIRTSFYTEGCLLQDV